MPLETIRIGSFEMESGKVIISDPCYGQDCWCMIRDLSVKIGTWNAWIKYGPTSWLDRCWELIAVHRDTVMVNPDSITYQRELEGCVGVDSGQAGIYDALHYKDEKVVPADMKLRWDGGDAGRWYGLNCHTTLQEIPNENYQAEMEAYKVYHNELYRRFKAKESNDGLEMMNPPMRMKEKSFGGVIPFGCVSSAGFGDGGYQAYSHLDPQGLCTGIKIIFIREEEEVENDQVQS